MLALFMVLGVVAFAAGAYIGPKRLRDVGFRLKQPNIWRVMAAIAVVALMMATVEAPIIWVFAVGLALLALFGRAWVKEFAFLMSLRDEDFPSRSDKRVWLVLMVGLAPVGYAAFRAFRQSQWPEPVVTAEAQAMPTPEMA